MAREVSRLSTSPRLRYQYRLAVNADSVWLFVQWVPPKLRDPLNIGVSSLSSVAHAGNKTRTRDQDNSCNGAVKHDGGGFMQDYAKPVESCRQWVPACGYDCQESTSYYLGLFYGVFVRNAIKGLPYVDIGPPKGPHWEQRLCPQISNTS